MPQAGAIRAGRAFVELFADDSNLVRAARLKRGWRMIDLAIAASANKTVIGLWETGDRLPSRDTLYRVATALRRSMGFLLLGKRGRKKIADPVRPAVMMNPGRAHRRAAGSG